MFHHTHLDTRGHRQKQRFDEAYTKKLRSQSASMPSATDRSTRPNFPSTFTALFRSTCAIQLQQPDLWHLHGRSFSRVLALFIGSFLKLFQKRSQKALPRSRLMHPYRSDFPPFAVVAPIAYLAPSFPHKWCHDVSGSVGYKLGDSKSKSNRTRTHGRGLEMEMR